VVLSEEFCREILAHPIPPDLEAIKVLSAFPASMVLFKRNAGCIVVWRRQ
jgi:hypothetical protein